jgi:hypothetical protein
VKHADITEDRNYWSSYYICRYFGVVSVWSLTRTKEALAKCQRKP